jgi:asparagine synthase (glutamine-hydrolysing)
LVQRGKATYAAIAEGHPVSFAVFKQGPWYHHGTLSLEQTQLSMRSPYLDNDFVRTVFRSPQSALASTGISARLISDGDRSLAAIPTDQGLAAEFERRGNPLSQAFLKFQFKAEYAYDMGMPQWLARLDHSFSAFHFERLFLGRHKPFHFRVWYRDGLSRYVRETLLDSRSLSRPYLNRKKVEAIVAGHLKGNCNFTTAIHKLLTLELQHRLFLDSDCAMPRSAIGGAVRHLSHGFGANEVSSSIRMLQ